MSDNDNNDIVEQMWTELQSHQQFADRDGHGDTWRTMCEMRTAQAADAAADAARALIFSRGEEGVVYQSMTVALAACAAAGAATWLATDNAGKPLGSARWREGRPRYVINCIHRAAKTKKGTRKTL
jgi:hypothetical protein